MNTTTPCQNGRLCNKPLRCSRCARIRQARYAGAVKSMSPVPRHCYFLVYPLQRGLQNGIRLSDLRSALRRLTVGGMWSVEVGERTGHLHLHALLWSSLPLSVDRLPPPAPGLPSIWMAPVSQPGAANLAAYSLKPPAHRVSRLVAARRVGSWGIFRAALSPRSPAAAPRRPRPAPAMPHVRAVISESRSYPVVAALALNAQLRRIVSYRDGSPILGSLLADPIPNPRGITSAAPHFIDAVARLSPFPGFKYVAGRGIVYAP